MLEALKTLVKDSKVVQLLLMFAVGVAIGAFFYPTKHIETKLKEQHDLETKTLNEEHSKELSQIRDTLDKSTQEYKSQLAESDKKISKLTTENTTLKSTQKTSYYKLIKPDGTIEVRKFSETQVDESKQVVTSIQEEFKTKIASIEAKWEKIHEDRVTTLQKEFDAKEESYKHQIDTLEESKVVDINKKSFGIEAGVLTSGSYYGHATYDFLGPIFLGVQAQQGASNSMGAGIGFRF